MESHRVGRVSVMFCQTSGDVSNKAFAAIASLHKMKKGCAHVLGSFVLFFFLIRGGGRTSKGARRAPIEAPLFLGIPSRQRDSHEEETGRGSPLVVVMEL